MRSLVYVLSISTLAGPKFRVAQVILPAKQLTSVCTPLFLRQCRKSATRQNRKEKEGTKNTQILILKNLYTRYYVVYTITF